MRYTQTNNYYISYISVSLRCSFFSTSFKYFLCVAISTDYNFSGSSFLLSCKFCKSNDHASNTTHYSSYEDKYLGSGISVSLTLMILYLKCQQGECPNCISQLRIQP